MKKMKTGIGVMLALLCCILMCTGVVYATGDGTAAFRVRQERT